MKRKEKKRRLAPLYSVLITLFILRACSLSAMQKIEDNDYNHDDERGNASLPIDSQLYTKNGVENKYAHVEFEQRGHGKRECDERDGHQEKEGVVDEWQRVVAKKRVIDVEARGARIERVGHRGAEIRVGREQNGQQEKLADIDNQKEGKEGVAVNVERVHPFDAIGVVIQQRLTMMKMMARRSAIGQRMR
jgi:hypothetical protein